MGGASSVVQLGGCYNAHTVPVTIGQGQTFALNLDTGSGSLAVASENCSSCVDAGVSPLYKPDTRTVDLEQNVQFSYDVGELGWSGEAYQDVVSIGGVSASVDFAAMQLQNNYFYENPQCDTPNGSVSGAYQGIIGFGPDSTLASGTNGYFNQAVAAGTVLNVFSIELCHLGGTFWLGSFDPAQITGRVQYTPMEVGTFGTYAVNWTDAIVGTGSGAVDVALPNQTAGATIDSGGDELIVSPSAFAAIASAISHTAAFQDKFGGSWFSDTTSGPWMNCMTLDQTPAALDAELPTLTIKMGSQSPIEVSLTATQSYLSYYVYKAPNQIQYCQTLISAEAAVGQADYFDLGKSLMLGHVLIYDRANSRFGVA